MTKSRVIGTSGRRVSVDKIGPQRAANQLDGIYFRPTMYSFNSFCRVKCPVTDTRSFFDTIALLYDTLVKLREGPGLDSRKIGLFKEMKFFSEKWIDILSFDHTIYHCLEYKRYFYFKRLKFYPGFL